MTPLDVFFERCEGPIVFGKNDCCIALADTILAAGGPDLMRGYRGRYRTKIGYLRVARREGFSTVESAAVGMLTASGSPVDVPQQFDVAMVKYRDARGGSLVSPAFYHSGRWNLRGERGLVSISGEPSQIYRVI